MAISTQQQSTLFKVFTGMFGAVPGGYYEELVGLTTAYGPKGMASILATSDLFKSIYPNSVGVAADFAQSFLTKTLGASFATANAEAFANDKAWLAANIEANGVGNAVFDYLVILDGLNTTTSPIYAAAQTSFFTQAVNAKTYLDNGGTSKDLTTLTTAAGDSEAAAGGAGQTFNLTTGLDKIEGKAGNDTINGAYDATAGSDLNAMSSIDTIDGGAGIDTFKISALTALTTVKLPTISNVEIITVNGADAVTLDTTSITGLTNLNTTKSVAVTLTAAATTDVSVSGATGAIIVENGKNVTITDAKAGTAITVGDNIAGSATTTEFNAAGKVTITDTDNSGANAIKVYGGTDVTVTATSGKTTSGNIVVGDASKGTATGAVSVTQNLNSDGAVAAIAANAIVVNGGKTVSVTQNANSIATLATSDNDIATSTVVVTADDKTTDVTVKAIATVTNVTKAAEAAVLKTAVVTFDKLDSGETATVNGLSFTAAKDLTAEQVAQAFANLTATDTQSSTGIVTSGEYAGANTTQTGWTTGSATGATVTYTANATGVTDFTATAKATKAATTAEKTAVAEDKSENAVTMNTVIIDENSATAAKKSITTVTVDGATSVTLGGTTAAKSLDALTTLSLANVTGTTALNSTGTSLNMTVNNVATAAGATVAVGLDATTGGATITNLTLNATGKASNLNLTAAAVKNLTVDAAAALNISASTNSTVLETVTIKGAAAVNLGAMTNETALKSFDASANTGGVTATINAKITAGSHTDLTTFTFSEGNDVVTLSEREIDKKINLGAGDDKITLAAGTTVITKEIDGGTGTNTIAMTAAQAVTATGGATFQDKISNFQKLSIGANAASGAVIDLSKMDNISYVISANNTANAAGIAAITTTAVAGGAGTAATDTYSAVGGKLATIGQSLTIAGQTLTVTATPSVAFTAAQVVSALSGTAVAGLEVTGTTVVPTGWGSIAYSNTATDLVLTSTVLTAAASGSAGNIGAFAVVNASATLELKGMANNGTLELTQYGNGATVTMADATSLTADIFNIVTKVATTDVQFGTVTVANVETININANDSSVDTTKGQTVNKSILTVTADKATIVNVNGNSNIDLTLTGSTKVTLIDAHTLEGGLTATTGVSAAAATIKGGLGNDNLTAAHSNDVLHGGTGADTLIVSDTANLVQLHGGEGKDTYQIGLVSNSSGYATINGTAAELSGDVIKFGATVADFNAAKIVLGTTAVFQDYVNEAAKGTSADHKASYFVWANDTYVVQNNDAAATFVNGVDAIVKIAGVVDFTYNLSGGTGTLEIA